jgi:hypothetical protein
LKLVRDQSHQNGVVSGKDCYWHCELIGSYLDCY